MNHQDAGSVGRLHRFDAIHDQVDDDLLDLNTIRHDRRHSWLQLQPQLDILRGQLTLQQCRHLLDGYVDVQRQHPGIRLFHQATDSLNDISRTISVFDDPFYGPAHVIQIGIVMIKEAQARLPVRDDGGKRLIDLMGNGGADFAQRRHPAGMGQRGLGGEQGLLGFSRAGDIHECAHHSFLARPVDQAVRDHTDMLDLFIGNQQPHFGIVVSQSGGRTTQSLLHQIAIVRVDTLQKKVNGGPDSPVNAEDQKRLIRPKMIVPDRVPRKAAGQAELLSFGQIGLASLQGIFRTLPILDIEADGIPFDNFSLLIAQRHAAYGKPSKHSIGAADRRLRR